ncbi:MAG TPA: DNA polymerase III subunit beta [Chlamydiales bacterium]|nr:DNA polymerase III subunit beta [Chlamydiales bacterium]
MKVVIVKTELVNIIGKIQSIVPSKPSSPILAHVLLEAIDGHLVVSATDLSVTIRCSTHATIVEEGSIALPAKRFFQLVRELTAPQIKISTLANDCAEITTGTSVFKIHGMNKAEFPHPPDLAGSAGFSIPNIVLKEMLTQTSFCAAREDSRYTLNGVQLQLQGQKATLIGTDGKRLAKTASEVQCDPATHGQYVISLKAVDEICKLLDESNHPVHVLVSQDKISIDSASTTLTAKLLAGQYPDVERVIPTKLNMQFSIHREELMSLLRQVSLFTSETSHSVRFSFETGQLHLSVISAEVGEGRVSMPVDYAGERLDIAFNPHFFIDILRHSKDETVRFGLIDSHNPGLVTDSSPAMFVIMPMRLNEVETRKEAVTVS